MEENRKLELLGRAPVPKALAALGLPAMAGMLVNALYNLADTCFVGGLGTGPMGAVTAAFPLGQLLVGVGLLFGNGAVAWLPRLLGRGDWETADRAASTAVYGAAALGAAVAACLLVFLEPVLRQIGASEGVMPDALAYAGIYVPFSLFNVFNVAMNNIVSGEGAAKTAMGALMAGAALNVALDPLLIYAFGLGVAGAAIATAVSQMATAAVYLRYILRGNSAFHFRPGDCRFSGEVLSELLKIGVPTLLFQLLASLSAGMTNAAAKEFGDSALAAMGPLAKIMSVGSLAVFGFLKGFQSVAGFSYGAGNFERLREAVRTALLWSTGFCLAFGLTAALCSTQIMGLFAPNDPDLVRAGAAGLRASGLSFCLFGFCTVYSFLFLAMGRAKAGCFLGACRQGLCFVPVILVLPGLWGLNGVLYAQPVADVLAALVTAAMAAGTRRELRG